MFKNYIKTAFRYMQRHKGYSFINIFGLAVGIACCLSIMLWIFSEISYDNFHGNVDDLYRVTFSTEDGSFHGYLLPGLLADNLKSEYPEIVNSTSLRDLWSDFEFSYEENTIIVEGKFADQSIFEMFTFPLKYGNVDSALTSPSSMVISEKVANALFGQKNPVGKTINIDKSFDLTVSAVVKDIPANSSIKFDFLFPFMIGPAWLKTWNNKTVISYVQLGEGSDYQSVNQKIIDIYNQHNPEDTQNNIYLQPFRFSHLHDVEARTQGIITGMNYIYLLSAIGLIVLIIACINFINLSTALFIHRSKEIGIRKVVGSNRKQLIVQFLGESLVFSVLGFILAVLIVELLLPYLNLLLGKQLAFTFSYDVVFGALGLVLLTGIISGVYPAFYMSSFNPHSIFSKQLSLQLLFKRKRGQAIVSSGRRNIWRKAMIVFQFMLVVIFIITASHLSGQLDYIKNKDIGIEKDDIVIIPLRSNLSSQAVALKQELLQNDAIENVSMVSNSITKWEESCSFDWETKIGDKSFDVGFNRIDYDFFKTFDIQLTEGRFFSRQYSTDATNAFIVNESAVRSMGLSEPVGKRISMGCIDREGEIVGVVKDFHTESLYKEIRPFAFILGNQFMQMCIKIKSGRTADAIKFIKDKYNDFGSGTPFVYSFLNGEFDNLYRKDYLLRVLADTSSLIAIILSCLGLIGMVSFMIKNRTKEIGVRKVHGATMFNLLTILGLDIIYLVCLANLIGWPIAYYVTNLWLANFAYHIDINLILFLLIGLITIMITVLTISTQALNITRINPAKILKYE